MLSNENKSKIISTGLYKRKIPDGEETWCRNGTYIVNIGKSDKYFMVDTYFRNFSIELTDENFYDFTLILDFTKVAEVDGKTWEEYAGNNRFRVATDSGGWQYAKYYVKKDCNPSRESKRKILQNEIKTYKWKLEWAEKELSELDENDYYE